MRTGARTRAEREHSFRNHRPPTPRFVHCPLSLRPWSTKHLTLPPSSVPSPFSAPYPIFLPQSRFVALKTPFSPVLPIGSIHSAHPIFLSVLTLNAFSQLAIEMSGCLQRKAIPAVLIGGFPLNSWITGVTRGGREGGRADIHIFNESKGKTELRLPVEVLKFSTRGFSWKGIVCGSIIARSLAPTRFLPSISVWQSSK